LNNDCNQETEIISKMDSSDDIEMSSSNDDNNNDDNENIDNKIILELFKILFSKLLLIPILLILIDVKVKVIKNIINK
jgi:hypothetical protein